MRNLLKVCVVSLAGALLVSPHVLAQTSPKPNRGGADTLYDKLGDTGSGGAAPRRDLTGFWAGQVAAKLNEVAPLTPWGGSSFRLHKNNSQFPVSESNDPIKGCEPARVPTQHAFHDQRDRVRTDARRMLELFQFNRYGAKSGRTGVSFPRMWEGTPPTPGSEVVRILGRTLGGRLHVRRGYGRE